MSGFDFYLYVVLRSPQVLHEYSRYRCNHPSSSARPYVPQEAQPTPALVDGKAPAVMAPFYSDTFPDVTAMPKLNPAALQSNDPREAMEMAQACAASDNVFEQRLLQDAFRDPTFYARLDDEEALKGRFTSWRLASVLQVLRTNPAPAVHATILSLCDNPAFGAHIGRTSLLLQVLVSIRPSPPEAIKCWRRHGATGALYQYVVPDALADNGSVPAIALLEEQLLEVARPAEDKRLWMRDAVIRHRFELPMDEIKAKLKSRASEQYEDFQLCEVFSKNDQTTIF